MCFFFFFICVIIFFFFFQAEDGIRDHCVTGVRRVLFRSPRNNFKPFFTLFSKFFPSFLHSTCSLSVSRQYLALDEVYHPIRPAFPSKPTLWRELATRGRPSQRRGSNPLWHPVPGTDLYPAPHESAPIDYNSEDFQLELFPVHSPLLGESWLVSFPPLSDMLKFSG